MPSENLEEIYGTSTRTYLHFKMWYDLDQILYNNFIPERIRLSEMLDFFEAIEDYRTCIILRDLLQ